MLMDLLLIFGNLYMWILVFFLLFFVFYWYLSVPSGLPPGPWGIPILGYLPFVGKLPHITYFKLGKKFGSVFSLYYGNRLVIVLNDWLAVKDAFVKQAEVFSGRIRDANFVKSNQERYGVVNNDGESWRQHRRFVANLRNNGVGKLSLEPLLLNEISYLTAQMKKLCGKPAHLQDLLYCSMSNNVNILITGHRYDYDHPTIQRIIRALKGFAESGQPVAIHNFLPWIACIPGSNLFTKHEERWNMMKELVSITKKILTINIHDRDNVVDSYVKEMNNKKTDDDSNSSFSMNGMLHICRDFLTAGTETTAKTTLWGMIYLTNYPGIQKKVQMEIDREIGREREPSYNDRNNTPYLMATITELHRIITLAPLSLPHRNIRETKLLGYRIPANTMIIPNLWWINNDPELWGDPENFRPERFIGSDGKLFVPEYFMAFSTGKRACAGEPLARMELYLYFASFLQHFNFVSFDGSKLPLDASEKLVRSPLYDKICIVERDEVKDIS